MNADAIRTAIKNSNLQYIWGQDGEYFKTTKETDASTCGADLKGDFISCLMGSAKIPAGTEGLCFVSKKLHYSEYANVGDWDLPKIGADIILTGAYYTFCTLITLASGNVVLAHAFKDTTHEPRIIGKVA